jgi:isopentenyl-diphosphate delta-isomerase type 1
MDQQAMMENDMLLAVDEHDILLPGIKLSKRDGHTFSAKAPRATLHRAFSFFLFDQDNKMLLTKRASSKITFPNVWTNTCCSHPLYGMTPNEVDDTSHDESHATAYAANFPAIKHAAIRKLKHELGIDADCIPIEDIRFISRFHYWAADTISHGNETPWGEHEVDYILFCQVKSHDNLPTIIPNPDEVDTYKYVSMDELRAMMAASDDQLLGRNADTEDTKEQESILLWSPWFRGIMERGGWGWWTDLKGSLAGKYTNKNVMFFDPPLAHMARWNLPSHTRATGVLKSSSTAAVTANNQA